MSNSPGWLLALLTFRDRVSMLKINRCFVFASALREILLTLLSVLLNALLNRLAIVCVFACVVSFFVFSTVVVMFCLVVFMITPLFVTIILSFF